MHTNKKIRYVTKCFEREITVIKIRCEREDVAFTETRNIKLCPHSLIFLLFVI